MPKPARWGLICLGAGLIGYLAYSLVFKSAKLELQEIATRMKMDCSELKISPNREIFGINISQTITGPAFNCQWNGGNYEVISRLDFDRLVLALIPKLPQATGLNPNQLIDDCQSLVYSASLDNQIAHYLLLTSNYAFVNYSGLGGLKQAMEKESIDIQPNPSACEEFSRQY